MSDLTVMKKHLVNRLYVIDKDVRMTGMTNM